MIVWFVLKLRRWGLKVDGVEVVWGCCICMDFVGVYVCCGVEGMEVEELMGGCDIGLWIDV